MLVSIILPTYNRAASLKRAIASVAQGIDASRIECELILVDNNSSDSTSEVARNASANFNVEIRYLVEPVPGLLAARHRGALEARGEVLIFIDDDVEVSDYWLSALVEGFSDSEVQLCGGKSLPIYENAPPQWMSGFWYEPPYGGRACVQLSAVDLGDQVQDVDATYIFGLNFGIRKRALFELGGFHPDLIPDHLQHFQGDGETGLSQKANKAHYRALYHHLAVVYHHIPSSRMTLNSLQRRQFYQGVCDSYSDIRAKGTAWQNVEAATEADVRQPTPLLVKSEPEYDWGEIQRQCNSAYNAGFRFHQRVVAECPQLLAWVLRANYWDYQLPPIVLPNVFKGLRRP
jgi:glucosyl-dolichyl phosphate glucuronosyltransferase